MTRAGGIAKDYVILNSGEKIFPDEIEAYYAKVAPIQEICVFTVSGMDGVRGSKVLWAVIRPDLDGFREFAEVNLRGVIKERFDNASEGLPVFKRIKGFTITMEKLPHGFFGRLKRLAVKRVYEPRVIAGIEGALPVTEEISPEDQALLASDIGAKVTACLKDQSGIRRPITLKDSLELDLAVDSLGRIELVSCLESAFDVRISDECVSRAFSVKDLILGINDELKIAEGLSSWEQEDTTTGGDYWKKHLRVLPNNESLNMLEFGTGYFAWLFRFVVTAVDCLIFRLFFRIKVEGAEKVPTEGAYILFANHTSFLDGPVIAASLPQRPVFQIFYFVFGPYFFRPLMKWAMVRNFVKMARVIPFDFSTHFLEALRSCFYVLERGKGLCFFPEGLRSTSGEIEEFKKGFGVLAKVTGAKLVPVAIHGAHEAWSSTATFPRLYPIRVTFGEPLLPGELEEDGMAMGAKNPYSAICIAARKSLLALQDRS